MCVCVCVCVCVSALEDEEFDMFAQTRSSSLAEQRKRFVFDDCLRRLLSPRAQVK